jgi:hypothetical protein
LVVLASRLFRVAVRVELLLIDFLFQIMSRLVSGAQTSQARGMRSGHSLSRCLLWYRLLGRPVASVVRWWSQVVSHSGVVFVVVILI